MASITWTKDGQTEELQFVENATGNYFVDSNDVVIAPILSSLDSAAAGLITAAVAHSNKLRLPAGTHYTSLATGYLFAMSTHVGLEIYGDGIENTIIQVTDGVTLTAQTRIFNMEGRNQSLHDLSIYNGAGMTGAFDWHAVDASGLYAQIKRVEVAGIYGVGTAGGSGIGLYQPRNSVETLTTLGTTVSAGSRVCTPPSMKNIYKGQRLGVDLSDVTNIESANEQVIVTAITATTFTATFANAHASSVTIGTPTRGNEYALVEDCIVRDSYQATAYGNGGAGKSVFRRCIAKNVGSNGNQHGWYCQGPVELIDCYGEGIGGYTYHGHMQAPHFDASGFMMRNCESKNPGFSHGIIDSVGASDGTNYDVPAGIDLNRYASVMGCIFRCTRNAASALGFSSTVPTIAANNIFEDTCISGSGSVWLDLQSDYSIATSNIFRVTNSTSTNTTLRTTGLYCTVSNNTIYNLAGSASVAIGTYSTASGNQLYGASLAWGAHCKISGNTITITGIGDHCLEPGSATNWEAYGNTLSNTGGGSVWFVNNACTGRFHHNEIAAGTVRYSNPTAGLIFEANVGNLTQDGFASLTLTGEEGRLTWFLTSAGTQPKTGYGAVLAAGLAQRATTGDTVLAGVATSDTSVGQGTFLVSQPGAVVSVILEDVWVKGNVVLPSVTFAGAWRDSGATTQPTYRKSYGILLDSGGVPAVGGTARMLIAQMG